MPRLVLLVAPLVAALGFFGCGENNSRYCEGGAHADTETCRDAGTGGTCEKTTDCKVSNFPICDVSANGGTCVQCTNSDTHLCNTTTPICANDVCTGCTKHTDCPESNVCMPDGSCALSTDVAYVDGNMGVATAACTKAAPCTKIDVAVMKKPIVKVTGTITSRCSLTTGSAKILADPGAKLEPAPGDNGMALEIKGDSNIEIYDLQISKAKGGNNPGITLTDTAKLTLTRVTVRENPGNGISVMSGELVCIQCLLASNGTRGIDAASGVSTITESKITDNIGGGIRVAGSGVSKKGAFHIVGNFIFRNGQTTKPGATGIIIQADPQQPDDSPNELSFNSISRNVTMDNEQGVLCTSGTPLIASNNIIWNNGSPGKTLQVSGNGCTYKFSDIGPIPFADTSNMNADPAFLNEMAGELHLTKDSMARGKADPATILNGLSTKDIDGDTRSTPIDIGADQFHMP